jgi:hypothetical protein
MKIVLIETLETNTVRRGFYPPSAAFGRKYYGITKSNGIGFN